MIIWAISIAFDLPSCTGTIQSYLWIFSFLPLLYLPPFLLFSTTHLEYLFIYTLSFPDSSFGKNRLQCRRPLFNSLVRKICWWKDRLPTPVFLGFPVAQLVKKSSVMWETWVWFLGWEDPLEKGKATHSSILAWRNPWTVQSMGSQRVEHNWATFTFIYACKYKYVFWNLLFYNRTCYCMWISALQTVFRKLTSY